jgi:CheY-like chemotaxis protein
MTTVLLVDSDAGVLSTLGLLMAAEGYVVRTETDGLRALALARHTPPGRPDMGLRDAGRERCRPSACIAE